jgi:hypothetical protein
MTDMTDMVARKGEREFKTLKGSLSYSPLKSLSILALKPPLSIFRKARGDCQMTSPRRFLEFHYSFLYSAFYSPAATYNNSTGNQQIKSPSSLTTVVISQPKSDKKSTFGCID